MKERNQKKMILTVVIACAVFILVILMALISSHKSQHLTNKTNISQSEKLYDGLSSSIAIGINHKVDNLTNDQKKLWAEIQHKKELLEKQSNKIDEQIRLASKDYQGSNKNNNLQLLKQLETKISELQDNIKSNQDKFNKQIINIKGKLVHGFDIGDSKDNLSNINQTSDVIWVTDVTNRKKSPLSSNTDPLRSEHGSASSGFGLFDELSKKVSDNSVVVDSDKKEKSIPAFTIPNPTVLTRAISLTPLVGRVPKGDDHLVWAPFQVLFMIEKPNLTSNGHQLDPSMGKMLGTATCVGDLLASANACYINVLTYIFPDGTIATAKVDDSSKGNSSSSTDQNFKGLGYITDAFGNPQIGGDRKSSLGIRIAMSGVTAAVTAYGGALSQASTVQSNNGAGSIIQQVTDANNYSIGQAVNGAGQAANKEWEDASKNMFDYIYTNNFNPVTKKLKRFNMVITQQLNFDYNKNGRKLSYDIFNSKKAQDDPVLG